MRPSRREPLAILALAAAGPALAAGAAPQTSPDTATNLATVTVSASLNQTRVEDMPLHTTVIGQDEIKLSAAQTLDQLLRTVPGFDFTGVPAAISDPTGQYEALAVAIAPDAGLIVELPDGSRRTVSSGEVSVRGLLGYT